MDLDDREESAVRREGDFALTQTRTFAADEMIRCERCARLSAPTRIECLYCGAPLPRNTQNETSEIFERQPTLRPLEADEQGFNIALVPDANAPLSLSHDRIDDVAAWLNLGATDLTSILESGVPVPLARAAREDEARIIVEKLGALNLRAAIFADSDLTPPTPPTRARKIEIGEEALTLIGGDETTRARVAWPEIILFVAGRIITKQIEVEERRGRAKSEIIDAREIVSDKSALDVHIARDGEMWRIESGNFNFSCLGAKKKLLVAENFAALIETLTAFANRAGDANTEVRCDDSYNRVRRQLALVWPLDERTEARGLRRASVGRFNTEVVTSISNETQFTRYSLLCREIELMRRA